MQLFAKLQITGAQEFVTVKGSIAHLMATYFNGTAYNPVWDTNTM